MGFPRQEYWSGLPLLPQGDLPNPGTEAASLVSLASLADSLPPAPPGKSQKGWDFWKVGLDKMTGSFESLGPEQVAQDAAIWWDQKRRLERWRKTGAWWPWWYVLALSVLTWCLALNLGFPGGSAGKEPTCNAGDQGSIPGLGRSPGGGHGN